MTPAIQESLLSAEYIGQGKKDKGMFESPNIDQHLDIKSLFQKNKAKTCASLYEAVQPSKGKQRFTKVDRNILQLMTVPIFLPHSVVVYIPPTCLC